ncbi:Hypothetical protein BHO_0028700 (plasmid) [Borrelia hermsii YBT]|uniref:CRASP family complement regulator-acquiring lipoprotein n=1 Tax=Borrelia hermsii TaxID=140 RepID=UPI0003E3C049|nr:CRASP family complement regulator-acquiring lipoprotein [Borrelia hermsii]AHH13057.1 Hypothetical protein BHO_0028700 [Borrelia hermsii YBT]
MKNYFSATLIFITFILIACNPNLKPAPNETRNRKAKILIDKLISQTDNIKHILNIHNNDKWVEDNTQFDMKGTNQLFDVITTDNNKKYKDNEFARREIYLAFEYHTNSIREFGTIANKLANGAIKGSNQDIQHLNMVINQVKQYARNYFLAAFTPLINKKDNLTSLSFRDLRKLTNKFKTLENKKQQIKNTLLRIKNDFNNNHNNIKTGSIANLIKYLTVDDKYPEQLTYAAITIDYICKDISSILGKI